MYLYFCVVRTMNITSLNNYLKNNYESTNT